MSRLITLTEPRFEAIPQFTRQPGYQVDYGWRFLLGYIDQMVAEEGLQLVPDFQRGHVWTEAQQIAFVEYALRGGEAGMMLLFNQPYWMGRAPQGAYNDFVCVDGLQRLTAAMRFLRDEIPAFGYRRSQFTDQIGVMRPRFRIYVNDLKTRAEVLTWYLEYNSGGTVHSPEELERVRGLLAAEEPGAAP